uniref:Sulfotransferase n=1 Tax=Ciona savignyi TaxID=51511 RepID=H2YHF1_CIOSA
IILLTNYRSGSTFLGQLFNQHPDAFYQFEPLYPFSGGCGVQTPLKVALLQRLLKCDFPETTDLFAKISGRFRKASTKELCSPKLCPFGQAYRCYGCGPLHLPRAMNVCRAKKVSVIKVIRLCDVTSLKPLLEDPALDFKVVHLVRDPRGIASSRLKISKDWKKVSTDLQMTCSRFLSNAAAGDGLNSGTEWLKQRYMRVRYEDLSLRPSEVTKQIYKFAEMEYLPSIDDWIAANTRASATKRNPYSTRRDSAHTMEAWRTNLNISQVRTIQTDCSRAMNNFGYLKVEGDEQLKNLKVKLI